MRISRPIPYMARQLSLLPCISLFLPLCSVFLYSLSLLVRIQLCFPHLALFSLFLLHSPVSQTLFPSLTAFMIVASTTSTCLTLVRGDTEWTLVGLLISQKWQQRLCMSWEANCKLHQYPPQNIFQKSFSDWICFYLKVLFMWHVSLFFLSHHCSNLMGQKSWIWNNWLCNINLILSINSFIYNIQ